MASLYVACPVTGCDGEYDFDVVSDSDDHRSWQEASLRSERCSGTYWHDFNVLPDDQRESVQALADRQAADYEPSEP